MKQLLWEILHFIPRLYHKLEGVLIKSRLGECGNNVRIGENVRMHFENVFIGNDVYIGSEAMFLCSRAKITIGDHVIMGPRVTVITGDHRIDVVGKYISEITDGEKTKEEDQPVKFCGDNWIGANASILKGVTIGEGAVVACGAVVTKNVPPFACVAGVPVHVIRYRFDPKSINQHKEILGRESSQRNV